MVHYISLLKFTDKGIANIKDSPSRAQAFKDKATAAGVTVESQYWTAGRFDGVLVLSAEREETILHLVTELAALGNVRLQTLRAFDAEEFEAIVRG